jgi:organic radical activating enzyme
VINDKINFKELIDIILNITNYCTMNCKHCLNNSNESGTHMKTKIFNDSIDKIKLWNPMALLISGGEPTDHPDFIEIVKYTKDRLKNTKIMIISNGLFTLEEIRVNKYKKLDVTFQITHDNKYYKKDIKIIDYDKFIYCDTIPSELYNIGRARNIDYKFTNKPKCVNFRSFIVSGLSFKDTIKSSELRIKLCNPVIHPNGNITIGETNSCYVVGDIYDDDKTIENNIKNFTHDKCNKCNGFNNISKVDIDTLEKMYSQYGIKF